MKTYKQFINENVQNNDSEVECEDEIDYLYHVTEYKYVKNILKNGLIPQSHNKIESHPDRIYVMNNMIGAIHFSRFLEDMYSDYSGECFKIFKINNKLIDIKLYYDQLYLKSKKDFEYPAFKALYTYDNIPPNVMELVDYK
jgi:hypothetical protein